MQLAGAHRVLTGCPLCAHLAHLGQSGDDGKTLQNSSARRAPLGITSKEKEENCPFVLHNRLTSNQHRLISSPRPREYIQDEILRRSFASAIFIDRDQLPSVCQISRGRAYHKLKVGRLLARDKER